MPVRESTGFGRSNVTSRLGEWLRLHRHTLTTEGECSAADREKGRGICLGPEKRERKREKVREMVETHALGPVASPVTFTSSVQAEFLNINIIDIRGRTTLCSGGLSCARQQACVVSGPRAAHSSGRLCVGPKFLNFLKALRDVL